MLSKFNFLIPRRSLFNKHPKEKLVILGTGWGGTAIEKYISTNLYDVTIVSPRNHFLFTPLLASTAVGTLNFTSIIDPVRRNQSKLKKNSDYQCAYAETLDIRNKTITCKCALKDDLPAFTIPYDKLAICLGAETNTFNIPGVYEYAYFLKEISHAMAIKRRLAENLELVASNHLSTEDKRAKLHVVIVGAGPTGIEFGAEFYDFMKKDVSKKFKDIEEYVAVTIIDSGKILSCFDEKLRKRSKEKISKRANFKTIEDTGVVEVHKDRVILSDGQVLKTNLVVWNTGLKPVQFIQDIENLEKSNRGYLLTDNSMRTSDPNIYAIGDCAEVKDKNYLQTAQQAEQQGKYLAKEVLNKKTSNPKEYSYFHRGIMAYIGGFSANVDMTDVKKLGPINLKLPSSVTTWQGIHSFIAWRSVYWTMLGRWHLRLQVPVDWTKSLIWGRDSSIFLNTRRPEHIKSRSTIGKDARLTN